MKGYGSKPEKGQKLTKTSGGYKATSGSGCSSIRTDMGGKINDGAASMSHPQAIKSLSSRKIS